MPDTDWTELTDDELSAALSTARHQGPSVDAVQAEEDREAIEAEISARVNAARARLRDEAA